MEGDEVGTIADEGMVQWRAVLRVCVDNLLEALLDACEYRSVPDHDAIPAVGRTVRLLVVNCLR
jgi:hypothetical protein